MIKFFICTMLLLTGSNAHALFSDKCKVDTRGNFDTVLKNTRGALSKKSDCSGRFDSYFSQLLTLAEGYPSADNKRKFSDFLLWASDSGAVSRQRAEELYNRYFTPKFLVLMSEYNVCSSICKKETAFIADLESELADKERGLIKICRDTESFTKANQLYSDSVVVVSAACRACASSR